ncbi:MAG: TetR/AcrR family transcriptional regulator [bacterium]|nr:TetR/AcrR family transcriptional regulator [bacterium]
MTLNVFKANPKRATKGDRTRAHILDTALELFLAQGFEATTMRQIAARAEVSVGNAYYYFASKEKLVESFHARHLEQHRIASRAVLEREYRFPARLAGVLVARIETGEAYKSFAPALARSVEDEASLELMRRVITDSSVRVHTDLREALPRLLQLYEGAILRFWLRDSSVGYERTRSLIESSAQLAAKLVTMAGMPLMGTMRKALLRVAGDAGALEAVRVARPDAARTDAPAVG